MTMKNLVIIRSGNMKIAIAFITMFMLTACNTIAGMGRDIQKTAEYTSTMMPEKKEPVTAKEQ